MNILVIDNDYEFCDNLANYIKSCSQTNIVNIFNNYFQAINFIREKDKFPELILLNLDIPNININEFIRTTPKNCKVVALSCVSETISKYINFPFFQRIFQKPIEPSILAKYLNLQNSIETVVISKSSLLEIFPTLGFNLNHSGTMYLIDGITVAVKNKLKKLSDIYALLASSYNNDPKIIGWSINNAINKAILSSGEEKIQSFFKIQDNRKITAKYIFSYFLNYSTAYLL